MSHSKFLQLLRSDTLSPAELLREYNESLARVRDNTLIVVPNIMERFFKSADGYQYNIPDMDQFKSELAEFINKNC